MLGLNKTKITTNNNTDKELTSADSTTVAAGAGIKWNKFMFDGLIAAATDANGNFGLGGGGGGAGGTGAPGGAGGAGAGSPGGAGGAGGNGGAGTANFLTTASLTYTF